jgi:2-iminobutanoate/2-iminopropanoate deaminase
VARPTGLKTPVAGSTPSGAYSPGIIAEGRLLYVSGQGPLRDGKVVSGSIESEVTLTLQNLAGVVQAAGATLADIVQCRVYLADIGDFDAMDSVYGAFLPDPKPARTTIGAALADGIKVEIDCVVVLPPSESQSGRAVC